MTNSFDRKLWDKLSDDPLSLGLVRRRILPALKHDVYIGELRPGREHVLILEIRGTNDGLPRRRPSSKGLKVDVDNSTPNLVNIQLTSTSQAETPLFIELVDDVVGVLATAPGEGAARRVLERIIAWQAFFSTRRDGFSVERAAGLFAELHILRQAFLPSVGATLAIDAWHGPDPALQDFQFGSIAVEVKSFRGIGPGHLAVNSERQLELIGLESLYVAYVRLDQRQQGTGWTLLNAIDSLRTAINDSAPAVSLLEQRLLSYGWHDSYADFRTEKYEVRSDELFHVKEDFPRITSIGLPNGVGGVSYSVDRSAIEKFRIPWDVFVGVLKESE